MSVKVRIPSPLRSYTNGADVIEAPGVNVGEVLNNLKTQATRPLPVKEHARKYPLGAYTPKLAAVPSEGAHVIE